MVQLEDIPALVEKVRGYLANILTFLPEKAEIAVTNFINEKINTLFNSSPDAPTAPTDFDFSILSTPLLGIWNTAKQIPTKLVAVVITNITSCFITADFGTFKKLVLGLFRDNTREKIVRAKKLLLPSLGKYAKAYAFFQFNS